MTDVIEDVEILLRRAIDCLTRILHGLRHRLNRNIHRPLNRRTLVRWISAFMPDPKDPRLKLQATLSNKGYPALERWASCGSLASILSSTSINQLVEEDLGDNIVRFRLGCTEEDSAADVFDDPSFFPQGNPQVDHLTSTPKHSSSSCSSLASNDPAASLRMAEMEEELAALRKQIAMLVLAQETSTFNKTITAEVENQPRNMSEAAAVPLPLSPSSSSSMNDSGCESESVPVQPHSSVGSEAPSAGRVFVIPAAPPPPPPPPPPPSSVNFYESSISSSLSFSEILQQRKISLLSPDDLPSSVVNMNDRGSVPNMADVLKDLGSVKLRAIARSPGGTPLKRKPDREPTDPAAIIAQALKKKFASHRGFSPDSDKENDSSSFTSDTTSPFGQHLLRKTKKRLSMLNDSSESWTPVASPLKQLNI